MPTLAGAVPDANARFQIPKRNAQEVDSQVRL